jgi:hypothetical protein
MSKLIESLTQLTEAPKVLEVQQGSTLEAKSHIDAAEPYLSPEAQIALTKRSYSTIHREEDGRYYQCIYLCVQTRNDKIMDGVKAIAEDLNALARRDLIHSAINALGSIELARIPLKVQSSVVYSFVLVPVDRLDEAKSLANFSVSEGECGDILMNLEPELKPGEFLAEISIGFQEMQLLDFSVDVLIGNKIQEYLDILPRGTEFVESVKCSISSVYLPVEVRFYNPLMKQFKQVKLIHTRFAEEVGNKVEQFSLLTGIEYIRHDGEIHL